MYFLVSPCDSLSCLNDGSCRVEAGVASCFCKGDYSGTTCEGEHLKKIFSIYSTKTSIAMCFKIHLYYSYKKKIMKMSKMRKMCII